MKKKLADEAEMERQRQQPLKEQDGCRRPHMEELQAEHQPTQPAIQESETDQVGHSCGLWEACPHYSCLMASCTRKAKLYKQFMTSELTKPRDVVTIVMYIQDLGLAPHLREGFMAL